MISDTGTVGYNERMIQRGHARITGFVILWTLVFHYETLRANYLSPLVFGPPRTTAEGRPLRRQLPKLPLLFPPAGWIMFFNVDQSYGFAEIYGIRGNRPSLLDPHDIIETRSVGYDNIHRNVLIAALSPSTVGTPEQCAELRRVDPQEYRATVLVGACNDPPSQPVASLPFCRFLRRKFPSYDSFAVVYAQYPDLIETPDRILRQVMYRCQ